MRKYALKNSVSIQLSCVELQRFIACRLNSEFLNFLYPLFDYVFAQNNRLII